MAGKTFLKNETFVARDQGGLHNSGARKVKCQLNFKITRIDALIKQIICKQNKSNLRKTSSNNFKPYLTCEKQPNAEHEPGLPVHAAAVRLNTSDHRL